MYKIELDTLIWCLIYSSESVSIFQSCMRSYLFSSLSLASLSAACTANTCLFKSKTITSCCLLTPPKIQELSVCAQEICWEKLLLKQMFNKDSVSQKRLSAVIIPHTVIGLLCCTSQNPPFLLPPSPVITNKAHHSGRPY